MTQPSTYNGATGTRGEYQEWMGEEAQASFFDAGFRVFISPPNYDFLNRLSSFRVHQVPPSELVGAPLAVMSLTEVGSSTISVSSVPVWWPAQGSAWISTGDATRRISWSSVVGGNTLAGVEWPDARLSALSAVSAGATVHLWQEVTDSVAGANALSFKSARSGNHVTWSGMISGVGYNSALMSRGNIVAIMRRSKTGVWGSYTERNARLGIILNVSQVADDASGAASYAVQFGGLLAWLGSVPSRPISIGKINLAYNAEVDVSSTLIDVSKEAEKGVYTGVEIPSADSSNAVDENTQTMWISDGVPYDEARDGWIAGGQELVIDEIFPNPPVGYDDEYTWFVLYNPGNEKSANHFQVITSADNPQWADWIPASETPEPDDTGRLDEWGTGTPWISYSNATHRLPDGVTVPPGGRLIVCRDLTKFYEMYDPGDAQVIQMPELRLSAQNGVLKCQYELIGAAPGIKEGDTAVWGTPTVTVPYYWSAPNIPNPTPGRSARRSFSGNVTHGHSGLNFIEDASPTPGDTRSKKRFEWISPKIAGWSLQLGSALGTGVPSEILVVDGEGNPTGTSVLPPQGQIMFEGYTEVIGYGANDGKGLSGIVRGDPVQNITGTPRLRLLVEGTALTSYPVSSFRLEARASGPCFGQVEVYKAKRIESNPDLPADQIVPGNIDWKVDWDLVFAGPVNGHVLEKSFDTAYLTRMLALIHSSPVKAELINPAVNLSGDVRVRQVISSPEAVLEGMPLTFRHMGSNYRYISISSDVARPGEYILYGVSPVDRAAGDPSATPDPFIYVGYNRARVAEFQIFMSDTSGSGINIASADSQSVIAGILSEAVGYPASGVVSIDKPSQIDRLSTAKAPVTGVIDDLCRRSGLVLVEWPDMGMEIFADPYGTRRHGYTESIQTFSRANSMAIMHSDMEEEVVSQVEVTVTDPQSFESITVRYPDKPMARGTTKRLPDLLGPLSQNYPMSVAKAAFDRARNSRVITVYPKGMGDWLWPIMRISTDWIFDRNNVQWGRYVDGTGAITLPNFTIEGVSTQWGFGQQKTYSCEIVARKL